ncbi:MAG: hypothetical protein NEA02_00745, partial [Thermoanaerobaculia bacterium]|nr:hypothetical protein [Thermoanaerobaculia bacterium]
MASRNWKDDLPTLVMAIAAQFGLVRAVDWARSHTDTSDLARRLVEDRFYFAPYVGSVIVVLILVRLMVKALNLRGIAIGEWLRSSLLVVMVGVGILVAAHLDQILDVLALLAHQPALQAAAHDLGASPFFQLLRRTATLRFAIDLVGLLVCLFAIRLGQPAHPEVSAALGFQTSKDWTRAGDAYLKAGDTKRARRMFKKARAWPRLAALEQRDGKHREAARLYEEAGDAYAWETSREWEAAGETAVAGEYGKKALLFARTAMRWDRLAEISEALGDHASLAEACRRLAEGTPAGPVKAALWKRAADAYRNAGRPGEAAEAYRNAQEHLLAGELFVESGRPAEAIQSFERSGALTKAALAAARSGDEKGAQELLAREAEGRGDLVSAAEAWQRAGQALRAAGLFEKTGDFVRAADAWKEAGRLEKAAPLYQRGGNRAAAAEAFSAAGQVEKAAALYSELKEYEKAAELFRGAGRLPAAAAALQAGGRFDDAAQLFLRTGRGLEAARCALLGGHRERAWEYLTGVPRSEPGLSEVFQLLARAHMAAGENKDAVHVLRELIGRGKVESENLSLHMTLLEALRASGDSGEGVELGRIAAFDPSVLEGAALQSVPFADVGLDDAMPAALIRTPAVHKSGPYASFARPAPPAPVQPPPLKIAAPATPPPAKPTAGFGMPETPESRYEILAELGRGGMGVVHKALDRKLDRHVALKILPWQLRGDETAMRYFKREARAIAALKHPNVVAL